VLGAGCLEFQHLHPRTSGAACCSVVCQCRMKWRSDRSSLSLVNASLSGIVVPSREQSFLFGRCLRLSRFGRRQCVETPLFRPRSPAIALQQPSLSHFTSCNHDSWQLVTSTAAALKLLVWGDTPPRWMGVSACHAPRCLAVVTLHVSKALLELCTFPPLLANRRA
jgi:hypothetical protein